LLICAALNQHLF